MNAPDSNVATVFEILARYADLPQGGIRDHHQLVADLHVDGDDFGMSVVLPIQKRLGFKAPRQEWERVSTVADLISLVRNHAGATVT